MGKRADAKQNEIRDKIREIRENIKRKWQELSELQAQEDALEREFWKYALSSRRTKVD